MTKIEALAMLCAAEHRAQGWAGDGDGYDIGVYYGDIEALAEVLGRAPECTERLDFESAVRAELDATQKGDRYE